MRLTIILIVTILATSSIYSQQDPAAKEILDRASEKMKSHETIEADFELIIDNRMDDLHSKSTGSIQVKGEKYYMESMGSTVYYNGTTMWSYMIDINEVTITEPSKNEGDFVDNPALIFSFYNRDFKYRLIGEAQVDNIWCYEIDLYPINLDQPYSRFKFFIQKSNDAVYMLQALSKDGIDYTIFIMNSRFNTPMNDAMFTFKPENYPDIEIVDMRF
jgi:outer membrane lipoprotein-sorting protein